MLLLIAVALLLQHGQIKLFHFASGPWGFAQEFKARLNAGVGGEALDVNAYCHLFPTIPGVQLDQHGFECDAMQGLGWFDRVNLAHGG